MQVKRFFHLFFLISVLLVSGCSEESEKIVYQTVVDETPPASVTVVTVNAANNSVLLSWKNPSDDDFYGTRVFFLFPH